MYQSKLNDENYRYKVLKMKAKYTWNKKNAQLQLEPYKMKYTQTIVVLKQNSLTGKDFYENPWHP